MPGAFHGPVGNDGEQLRALQHRGSEQLGKPQIVANKRGAGESAPGESHHFRPRRVMVRLGAESEWLHFCIARQLTPVGGNDYGLIPRTAIRSRGDQSGHDRHAQFPRRPREEAQRFGRLRLLDPRDIHAESRGKHLGHDDQ